MKAKVIEKYKNWEVPPGSYVDLLEEGGMWGAHLVLYPKKYVDGWVQIPLLCGWIWIDPQWMCELWGMSCDEIPEIETIEDLRKFARQHGIEEYIDWDTVEYENGHFIYPMCFELVENDTSVDTGEVYFEGREAKEKLPEVFGE